MKLLFFVGDLSKNLNATNKIAYELAEHISRNSQHSVTVFGVNYNESFSEQINERFIVRSICPDNMVSAARKKLDFFLQNTLLDRSTAIKKFSLLHPFSALLVHYSYSPKYIIKEKVSIDYIEKSFSENEFDFIIAFQEPLWAERTMMKCNIPDDKKIIYQADPFGLHELIQPDIRPAYISEEISNFSKVKHVFTTLLLDKIYHNHPDYSNLSEKITGLGFPNIRKISVTESCPVDFCENNINIVFCGLLDDSYRSPEIFFLHLENLIKRRPEIKFYFWGDITSYCIYSFRNKYPDNIFIHARVSSDTSAAIQRKADFLLNIGNSVTNQVPSKIFDYFSLGKPIINIQKIVNCPSAEYMDRYPLCYTFFDYSPDISGLEKFIDNTKGKTVPFEKTKELFLESTPEYVSQKIIEILSN